MRDVVTPMMRSMGLVLVTLLLLVQLTYLPIGGMIFQHFGKNRPWMKLPVATNQKRCCVCFFGDELSWTKTRGWVSQEGAIQPEEMEEISFRTSMPACHAKGWIPIDIAAVIGVRILAVEVRLQGGDAKQGSEKAS